MAATPAERTVSVAVPSVPYPGAHTDAYYLRTAARNLRGGYPLGGSNVTATVATLLARVADALDVPLHTCPGCDRTDVTVTSKGVMRHHMGREYAGRWRQVCKGVGQPPVSAGSTR